MCLRVCMCVCVCLCVCVDTRAYIYIYICRLHSSRCRILEIHCSSLEIKNAAYEVKHDYKLALNWLTGKFQLLNIVNECMTTNLYLYLGTASIR